jgi:hypothetical protein
VADTTEIALGDGDAPISYTLSQGQELAPYSVEATFDGSGGSFLPCCTIYAQDGRKLARTFPAEAMAAGDLSGVTFAPF